LKHQGTQQFPKPMIWPGSITRLFPELSALMNRRLPPRALYAFWKAVTQNAMDTPPSGQ
jgi:hypothetical protein